VLEFSKSDRLSGRRPQWHGWVLCLNAAVAALMWTCFVSHGFSTDGILDGVYEIQARSLAQGHISIVPGPLRMFCHDVIMYWGNSYFYWGLLPSAVFLVLDLVVERLAAHYVIVFSLFFLLLYFFQRIVGLLFEWSRPEEGSRSWVDSIGVIALTWVLFFAIPYPVDRGWFFGRFVVYEQQIIFGLALAMPGFYFLIRSLNEKRSEQMAVAALFFAIASWTRVTWFPLSLVLVAGTICAWARRSDRSTATIGLIVPSLILILGLFAINYARFGSLWDFGVRYQNPSMYAYLRNLKMFFSPFTRLDNLLFNIASYYAPPDLVAYTGLTAKSFSRFEGFPPSFFYFNPQFIPLAVLTPFAIIKCLRSNERMFVALIVLASATIYLNVIFGLFGTMVIMRYFVEFYYFMIMMFLGSLLVFVRPKFAVPLLVIMLAQYIPGDVSAFLSQGPELRTLAGGKGLKMQSRVGGTLFCTRRVVWPLELLSSENFPFLKPYDVMGVSKSADGTLTGKDLFAVYIIPKQSSAKGSACRLRVVGMRSLGDDVAARFFIENRFIGALDLHPGSPVDGEFMIRFDLPRKAPYQILCVVPPRGSRYLPGRSAGVPVVAFREIRLESGLTSETSNSHLP
jgi:hypothetical protein